MSIRRHNDVAFDVARGRLLDVFGSRQKESPTTSQNDVYRPLGYVTSPWRRDDVEFLGGTPNATIHDCGTLSAQCQYCSAKFIIGERLSKSSTGNPKFGLCCGAGKKSCGLFAIRLNRSPIYWQICQHVLESSAAISDATTARCAWRICTRSYVSQRTVGIRGTRRSVWDQCVMHADGQQPKYLGDRRFPLTFNLVNGF